MTPPEQKAKTANTKMTEDQAKKIVGTKFPSKYWDGCSPEYVAVCHSEAKGFLAGLQAGREACENNHVIKTMNIYEDPMYKRGRAEMAHLSAVNEKQKSVIEDLSEGLKRAVADSREGGHTDAMCIYCAKFRHDEDCIVREWKQALKLADEMGGGKP